MEDSAQIGLARVVRQFQLVLDVCVRVRSGFIVSLFAVRERVHE